MAKLNDVTAIRNLLTSFKEQNCSLMAKYSEPIKKLAEALNDQLGTVLGALPDGEAKNDWMTEDVLNSLFNSLNSANAICTQLSLEVSKLGTATTTAAPEIVQAAVEKLVADGQLVKKDGIEALVAAGIQAKIDAGELVSKPMVDQLCSDAKVQGEQAGRAALQSELDAKATAEKLATDRKEALTQASIPLPPTELEAVLRESDENFAAAQKRFTDREAALQAGGVTLASDELRSNLWRGDAEYQLFERTVKSIPALKQREEPLAGPAPKPEAMSRMLA